MPETIYDVASIGAGPVGYTAAIRAGRFDAPGPERLRVEALLWRLAILKLKDNNPDFLIDFK